MKNPALLSLLCFLPFASCSNTHPGAGLEHDTLAVQARGPALYAAHCAVCHGANGAGDGVAYAWLFPSPRDFTSGRFRLVSTDNGVPTDEDLIRTLKRGMPGSAMPSWSWMPDSDLREVARHVRELATDGLARRIGAEPTAGGCAQDLRSALTIARERMTPGYMLPAVGPVEADAERLEQGRALFEEQCSVCHGLDGSGDPAPRRNEDGSLNWARDFTAGFLKGGAESDALAWRIQAGIPGTAMASTQLEDPEDVRALVAYVQYLIPEGTDQRMVQVRQELVAQRVDGELPEAPDHPLWESRASEIGIALSPLNWNESSVIAARLSAFHDGERVSIRVTWRDPTGEPQVFSEAINVDAVALQLSSDRSPQLFGMGRRDHPTNIWHWRALRLTDIAGYLDLFERTPHTLGEPFRSDARPDVPIYHSDLGRPGASEVADSFRAEGVGRKRHRSPSSPVEVQPRWEEGRWEIVFTRPLAPGRVNEIDLASGTEAQLAVAIWNGAAGDRQGQKSISIWHGLKLAR